MDPTSKIFGSSMTLFKWFWNDDIWLPPNVTWTDLEQSEIREGVAVPKFSHLWYPIPASLIVIAIRYVVERHFFRPFGIFLGLRATKRQPAATNDVLEECYETGKGKIPRADSLTSLSQQLGMTVRQVERWFRIRRMQNKPSTLDKFSETGWRGFYYSSVFLYGCSVLWNKPWLWDIKHCWYNYPLHRIDSDVWWYYMVELSFYWALCISQFFDVKRKDFWEMFIHHVTTIALMGFSWTCNLTRVGTLVLVIHDCADIFLEAAKLCKYTNYQKLCDLLFACFALTWVVTRLGVYPTWILYSTTIEAPQIVEMFPAYYIFNGLLAILLVLHVIWTYFILKIIYKAMYSGKTEQDTRSDSDDEETVSSSTSAVSQPPSPVKKMD